MAAPISHRQRLVSSQPVVASRSAPLGRRRLMIPPRFGDSPSSLRGLRTRELRQTTMKNALLPDGWHWHTQASPFKTSQSHNGLMSAWPAAEATRSVLDPIVLYRTRLEPALWVRNVAGTSGYTCGCCRGWLEHHARHAGYFSNCSAFDCEGIASVGAHLAIVQRADNRWWIAPLCHRCNHRTEVFQLRRAVPLVRARHC